MTQVDIDVLVVGAGACGLAAAIAAHDAGASVAMVEKLDRPGGNSALSAGSVSAAGSRFQREAGITDSPDTMVRDLMAIAGETDDAELVRRLAEVSAGTVEWLVDTVGARLKLVTAYKHIGHSVPRLHAPVSRRGQDLVADLLAAVPRREIPLAVGSAVLAAAALAAGEAAGATGTAALGALCARLGRTRAPCAQWAVPSATTRSSRWKRQSQPLTKRPRLRRSARPSVPTSRNKGKRHGI